MTIHITPATDAQQHDLSSLECPCNPDVQYIDPETGVPYPGNGPMVVHHCFEMPDAEKTGWEVWDKPALAQQEQP